MNAFTLCIIFSVAMQSVSSHLPTAQNENVVFLNCEDDSTCEEDMPGSRCVDSICTCLSDADCQQKELTQVVTKVGEKCHSSAECLIEHSLCVDGKCKCENATVGSSSGKFCLLEVDTLGLPCKENIQCHSINGSECLNGTCRCNKKMHDVNGACFSNKVLGDKCKTHEECTQIEFSGCLENKCKCIESYIQGSSGCLLIAEDIMSPCIENLQCTSKLGGGAHCADELCNCKEMYQFKRTTKKCVRDISLGEICSEHEDCHQPGNGSSRLECLLGECQCKPNFIQEGEYCINGMSSTIVFTLLPIGLALFTWIL